LNKWRTLLQVLVLIVNNCFFLTNKGYRSEHLYTATYSETRTAALYNAKWRTDRQWHRWRSASSDSPLPEWMDFGPHSLQL